MNRIDETMELVRYERRMRHVQRLAGTPIIKAYSLAEHCYFTGLLFETIAMADEVPVSVKDWRKVLRHDVLEIETGDLLYPAKHTNAVCERNWDEIERVIVKERVPFLREFMDDSGWSCPLAHNLFKACDLLELFMFCVDERRLGNNSTEMNTVISNIEAWMPKMLANFPTAQAIAESYAS